MCARFSFFYFINAFAPLIPPQLPTAPLTTHSQSIQVTHRSPTSIRDPRTALLPTPSPPRLLTQTDNTTNITAYGIQTLSYTVYTPLSGSHTPFADRSRRRKACTRLVWIFRSCRRSRARYSRGQHGGVIDGRKRGEGRNRETRGGRGGEDFRGIHVRATVRGIEG